MKQMLLMTAFILGSLWLHAQKTIQGRVTDALNNTPLMDATVSYGKGLQTKTGRDGTFTIECGTASRIMVSYVGYESRQYFIRNCDEEILVSLTPSGSILSSVEITATSSQNKKLLYQPLSITKLGQLELKRSTGLFLDDAINTNVPGVIMQRRAVSSGQQINIRGYGNGVRGTNGISSNFDIQGSKIYLNGIPLTDAEGITVMDDIDFGSIGNVEVVKGPSGTLYGLAIAGVVNLNTVQPEKGKTSIGQDVIFGNYGLRRYTTRFEMATDHSSLLLNYGRQESDGFMPHNASKKKFLNLAGNIRANEKEAVNFYAGYSESYDQRAGELTIAQYESRDYSGNPAYIQRDAHSAVTSFRLGLGHVYHISGKLSNNTTVFGSGMNTNASSAGGWTDKTPVNYGLRSTFDTRFSLSGEKSLTGVTGVELQQQNAQVTGYFMKADPYNPSGYYRIDTIRSNQVNESGTKSIFTEWTLSLPKDLSLTAGVGWSTMKIDLNDRFIRPGYTRPTHFEKDYTGMVSPHFAINKVFGKSISAYLSYSRGYKAPVSSYFFIPVSTSSAFLDSTLKPETGNQFEIGTKGSVLKDRLTFQLALFKAVFSNKMTAVAVPLNPPAVGTAYTYVANGGKQDNKGLEVAAQYTAFESQENLFSRVRPFVNFTYSRFRYKGFGIQSLNADRTAAVMKDYSGKEVAGVPPVSFNAGLDVQTLPGIYLNATYSYRDRVYITSDNLNRAKSYSLLNAKLGFRRSLTDHFDLDASFGINNITGTQYYQMIFVNQLPDAYLPAPLNTVYFGGLSLKYNFQNN